MASWELLSEPYDAHTRFLDSELSPLLLEDVSVLASITGKDQGVPAIGMSLPQAQAATVR